MKLSVGKFRAEMEKVEQMLVDNLDAEGESFTMKVVSVQRQVPKGVCEKLSFLAHLYERVNNGEKPDEADMKQAGFWIDAIWPYLSNGVPRGSRRMGRVGLLILALVAIAVALYFLH